MRQLPPVHPGEILREEFMVPLGLTCRALAEKTCLLESEIIKLVNEQRGITPDLAKILSEFFGNSVQFWLNLQSHYESEVK